MNFMAEALKYFIAGLNSVLDIYPGRDYSNVVPSKSLDEMMAEDWKNVGDSLWSAISQVKDEQLARNSTDPAGRH